MSVSPTKPVGKKRTVIPASPSGANVNDDVVPILLATNPNIALNYKLMTAIDPQRRTFYAWEHKCRKWRAKSKDLVDAASAEGESSKDASDTAGKLGTKRTFESQGFEGEDAPIKAKKARKAKTKVETDIVAEKQATPNATRDPSSE